MNFLCLGVYLLDPKSYMTISSPITANFYAMGKKEEKSAKVRGRKNEHIVHCRCPLHKMIIHTFFVTWSLSQHCTTQRPCWLTVTFFITADVLHICWCCRQLPLLQTTTEFMLQKKTQLFQRTGVDRHRRHWFLQSTLSLWITVGIVNNHGHCTQLACVADKKWWDPWQ